MTIRSGGNRIILGIFVFTFIIGHVQSLKCWHCIADDCADDVNDNYKASQKTCRTGQSCQKVYFEMVEKTDDGRAYIHKSTVRGCSEKCTYRNDFGNCSYLLKTSRGCVRKDCCADGDLCNSSSNISPQNITVIYLTCLCLYKMFVK